jgi:hypothetical protein
LLKKKIVCFVQFVCCVSKALQIFASGRGHLACLSFAGGRPINRRRALPRHDEDRNIRDDVKFLSYYNRARGVAQGVESSLDLAKGWSKEEPQPKTEKSQDQASE